MTLTELFNAKREEAKEEALAKWSKYLQERSSVEDLQETVRVFSGKLSREADSAYEEYTPLKINGFESSSSGSIRTNDFLRCFCRDLEYALRVFKPNGDPIAEYLKRDKETRIVDWFKQTAHLDPTVLFKPEAYKMSDDELAELLGEYQGRRDALKSILDRPDSGESNHDTKATTRTALDIAQEKRTQVMLVLLLLRFYHGVHISARKNRKGTGTSPVGFNQKRLAKVLAMINNTSEVGDYTNSIKDVLKVYGDIGSEKLLKKVKNLIDYISGDECTELSEAISDEIDLLHED